MQPLMTSTLFLLYYSSSFTTLFLLYVNDLSSAITDASLDMYVDDATISCFGDTLDEAAEKLNICLTSVSHWFNINRLVINTSKSNFLVTSTRSKIKQLPEHIHIKFNDVNLKRIRSTGTKLLGIFLDEILSFNDHITYLKQKVAPQIALIHCFRSFLPESSPNQVSCLLFPHFLSTLLLCGEIPLNKICLLFRFCSVLPELSLVISTLNRLFLQ